MNNETPSDPLDFIYKVQDLIAIQKQNGNYNNDEYMYGMLIGMELVYYTILGKEAKFTERPKNFLNDSTDGFYEYNYAVRHRPTGKWIEFENDELELSVIVMTLVDFKHCTISKNKAWLSIALKNSIFNGEGVPNLEKNVFKGIPNYGKENFLEFEFVELKTTYTIEEESNSVGKLISYDPMWQKPLSTSNPIPNTTSP